MIKQELQFLIQSNAIEDEYAPSALDDAVKAWKWAKKNRDNIDLKFILEVHQRLMININPVIAGNIRKCDVWVGNRKCLDPKYIEKELRFIARVTPSTEQGIKEWHILFEKIHPFEDGNGRTGRILMNIQRLNLGLPILIIHEGKEQQEYYKWFSDQDKGVKDE